MHPYRTRTAESIATTLLRLRNGAGVFGMPVDRRARVFEWLSDVVGAERDAGAALRVGGVRVASEADARSPSATRAVNQALGAWKEREDAPMLLDEMPRSRGSVSTLEAAGVDGRRLLSLAVALGSASATSGAWTASAHVDRDRRLRVALVARGAAWRDGMVTLATGALPRALVVSLDGATIERITGPSPLARLRIERASPTDPRDGRLRLRTADAYKLSQGDVTCSD